MNKKRTRSIYFIDHEVQSGLLLRLAMYWAASILFVTLPLAFIKTATQPGVYFFAHLADVFYVHWPILGMLVLFLPMAMNDAIRYSNRFAGPVYRMRAELSKFDECKPIPEIRLRENDYWHDLADRINRVTSRLNELEEEHGRSRETSQSNISQVEAEV